MSIKGRLERLERAVPKDETVSEISEEQGQEALALLRATIAYRGQDSYEADELRAKLGGGRLREAFRRRSAYWRGSVGASRRTERTGCASLTEKAYHAMAGVVCVA